uniref:VPS9 domain-containing protein n=1 Tax=Coccidioides posadasii RMSCC 3488 TaxID=454284 RepID=A0A0J6FHL3_COCPO|nr:hypothetical protein CPAG_06116 [Coccidioides posadasii RMSCC 3488]
MSPARVDAPLSQSNGQCSCTQSMPSMTHPFSRIALPTVDQVVGLESMDPVAAPFNPLPADGEPDVFEKQDSIKSANGNKEQDELLQIQDKSCLERFDDLPIEMISLTDRFVESLSAKVYDTPPSIDKLSSLFQDFYIRASSHVETHISILASRLRRGDSPSPSRSQSNSKYSFTSKISSSQKGDRSSSGKKFGEQQMLTATEVTERRRTRKLFQYKRQALEEAIEKRACESVYDKIWRHRSTLDEVRDEKLRSKTAALAVIGFGLKDLGVDIDDKNEETTQSDDWLAAARHSLIQMNDAKFPLGKLQHLTTAHKAIVDSLTRVLPSSSSADEILPTLIFALVTSPPEGMNVISNLLFIQRFRAANRIDGETAYCLTNLEAAISFLENVDLTSTDEIRNGTLVSTTCDLPPETGDLVPLPSTTIRTVPDTERDVSSYLKTDTLSKSQLAVAPHHRLSSIFQPPAKALGAANDIVRNTADLGIKNISNTLDNSFKFLFGRLKEVQVKQGEGTKDVGLVPKTLDDARRLVNNPVGVSGDFPYADGPAKCDNSARESASPRPRLDDRLASLIAGRKPPSDRTVRPIEADSDASNPSSSKPSTPSLASSNAQTSSPAFGSMRSFGNTLNPLNHIPGMIRGLSRSSTESSQVIGVAEESSRLSERQPGFGKEKVSIADVAPPIKRFMELEDAAQLTLGEIPKLLDDYKRLASVFNNFRSD